MNTQMQLQLHQLQLVQHAAQAQAGGRVAGAYNPWQQVSMGGMAQFRQPNGQPLPMHPAAAVVAQAKAAQAQPQPQGAGAR